MLKLLTSQTSNLKLGKSIVGLIDANVHNFDVNLVEILIKCHIP